jgi:hypothetical protein
MRIRLLLVTGLALLTVGCRPDTAPMNADYHGPELTTARTAGERLNADRLTRLKAAVPQVHDLGSTRHDSCRGGTWFPEDRYYMPYECRTATATILSFAGDLDAGTDRVLNALVAGGCGKRFRELLGRTTADWKSDPEPYATSERCPAQAPLVESTVTLTWSPVQPSEGQFKNAFEPFFHACVGSANCEHDGLDARAALQTAPAGDQWVVIAEFETFYWLGTPISG